MTEGAETFSRAKLQDTDKTAQRFYAFGLEGIPNWVIALRLDCHYNTICTFLRRAPKSRDALARGREEGAAQSRAPGGSAFRAETDWRAAQRPAAPKLGETCPTCGQEVHDENAVVMTPEMLADARRRFEALIDRHIADRRREARAGQGQDDGLEEGQAEAR